MLPNLIWLALTVVIILVGLIVYFYLKLIKERNLFASEENEAVFLRNCTRYGVSAREIQVLRLVLQGKTYAQVSDLLYISKKTVDSHVQNIYAKVGVRNKLELIQKLYR
ncbi:MAG: helix-turn-helix transcriptional regulator [Bacteroidota bacterium]